MMEEDFYATIKFKSGEEIFSKVSCSEEEDRTILLLDNPVTIEKVRNKGSIYGYKFEPWLKTSKEDLLIINLEDVLTLVESKDVETIAMHKTFSHHQNQYYDTKQKKLNRRMGYISTINEAKASLEKLFKDN
tara:strand:- start:94 stop:489 length:396 start_codon:yes stop_codon:yes gene_type:complete